MSKLLTEVIADRKAGAIEYEEYLKRIAEIVRKVDAGKADDTPVQLDSPGKRAIFNLLRKAGDGVKPEEAVDLVVEIDETVKTVRPDGWRGVQAKEQIIKAALYGILQDADQVEELFTIISAQREY